MTSLSARKRKLRFLTSAVIRHGGKAREVVIEAEPTFARVRLKGLRTSYAIGWDGLFWAAAKLAAEQRRREKRKGSNHDQ